MNRLLIALAPAVLIAAVAMAFHATAEPLAQETDDPPRAVQASPPSAAPVSEPIDLLMFWHDRAFGQARLGIARKDRDRVRQNIWLLSRVARMHAAQREDKDYSEIATAVATDADAILLAIDAREWDKAEQAALRINANCQKCHDQYATEASGG